MGYKDDNYSTKVCGHHPETCTCRDWDIKKEPKQIYYNTVGRENGVFVIKGQFNTQKEALDLANELNEKGLGVYYDWNETLVKEEPIHLLSCCKSLEECHCGKYSKQETLEEAIYKIFKSKEYSNLESNPNAYGFMLAGAQEGAKYQAERMYSEEEVNKMFDTLKRNSIDNVATISNVDLFISSWVKQFKKK